MPAEWTCCGKTSESAIPSPDFSPPLLRAQIWALTGGPRSTLLHTYRHRVLHVGHGRGELAEVQLWAVHQRVHQVPTLSPGLHAGRLPLGAVGEHSRVVLACGNALGMRERCREHHLAGWGTLRTEEGLTENKAERETGKEGPCGGQRCASIPSKVHGLCVPAPSQTSSDLVTKQKGQWDPPELRSGWPCPG